MSVKVVSQTASAVTPVSRAYWLSVLGGLPPTRVPRWSEEPDEGIGTVQRVVPEDLQVALERLALCQAVPLATLVLAAHVKVLSVLSGEREVTTGYVAVPGRCPVPCRVSVSDGAWRDLLRATARAEADLLPHHAFPVGELRAELGLSGPAFETELDPTGGSGPLSVETVFGVAVSWREKRPVVTLRHRRDCPGRRGGLADRRLPPHGARPAWSPIRTPRTTRPPWSGPPSCRAQIDGLAGPTRELPDLRLPDLFALRAATHPDRVAAEHGDRDADLRGARRPGEQDRPRPAGPRAPGRGRRGRRHRAHSRLDGVRARRPAGGWHLPPRRAALPRRPHRRHAAPLGLPAGPDRDRPHGHASTWPRRELPASASSASTPWTRPGRSPGR